MREAEWPLDNFKPVGAFPAPQQQLNAPTGKSLATSALQPLPSAARNSDLEADDTDFFKDEHEELDLWGEDAAHTAHPMEPSPESWPPSASHQPPGPLQLGAEPQQHPAEPLGSPAELEPSWHDNRAQSPMESTSQRFESDWPEDDTDFWNDDQGEAQVAQDNTFAESLETEIEGASPQHSEAPQARRQVGKTPSVEELDWLDEPLGDGDWGV